MRYNLSMAIEQVGGFGFAQKMLAFVTSIARNANGYFVYPFAYLVLQQEYLCDADGTGVFESCTKE